MCSESILVYFQVIISRSLGAIGISLGGVGYEDFHFRSGGLAISGSVSVSFSMRPA